MSVISVRVPKDLKDRMSTVRENWAEYLRQMIEHRIRQHDRLEASKTIDRIRLRTKQGAYVAAKTIREDRDRK